MVWLPFLAFSQKSWVSIVIPIDELSSFSEGFNPNHQPVVYHTILNQLYYIKSAILYWISYNLWVSMGFYGHPHKATKLCQHDSINRTVQDIHPFQCWWCRRTAVNSWSPSCKRHKSRPGKEGKELADLSNLAVMAIYCLCNWGGGVNGILHSIHEVISSYNW